MPVSALSVVRRVALGLGVSLLTIVLFLVGMNTYLQWRAFGSVQSIGMDEFLRNNPYEGSYIFRHLDDPEMGAELVPDSGHGRKVVNDLGYIGKRYPVERSADSYRILGLGDSVTMYFGAEGTNYLSIMENQFREKYPRPAVEVLNFGVAGYDTLNEVKRLETRGTAFHPDLVTVGYVLNDAIDFPFTINTVFGKALADNGAGESLPVIRFLESRLAAVTTERTAYFDKVFGSDLWHRSLKALDRLEKDAAAQHFQVVLVVFPVFIDMNPYVLQPIHDALRVEAEKHHFGFLDLAPVYAQAGKKAYADDSGNLQDAIHPTERGHAIAGRALFEYLVKGGYGPAGAPGGK